MRAAGLATPVIAANALSNYNWMHSGGGHYSASIVAFLVIGAIEGTDWLSRRWAKAHREIGAGTALATLSIGLVTHWLVGISPLAWRWNPPILTSHHRTAQRLLAEIPAEAEVIAQSALYPHLATRRRVMLFPSASEADFIALDVTSATYPLSTSHYRRAVVEALARPGFRVRAAENGVVILERGAGATMTLESPDFTSFALARDAPTVPLRVKFGDELIRERR